jgi:hypothetical protein
MPTQSTKDTCNLCKFSERLVKKGDKYTVLNVNGDETVRVHEHTVFICRLNPPVNDWPHVGEDDWCGQFQK